VVPYGKSSTTYTLSWNAPGYSQVTYYGKQNLQYPGQIQCLGNGGQVGLAQQSAAVGEVATLWLLPYTGCTPGTFVSALPRTVLATLNFTATQGTQPKLTSSSNPVIVPYGNTSASYTLSWNAPGYSQVSFYSQQNLQNPGQIVCVGNGSGSGTLTQIASPGEMATFWMLQYTCRPGTIVSNLPTAVLATLNLTAKQGTQPTMKATPNPVVVPAGQTTANYTLTWDAPGYSQVTLYGKQNLQNPGQIQCLGSGSGSGTAPEPMSVGETATLWLLSYTGCIPGTIVSALPSAALVTLSASGTH